LAIADLKGDGKPDLVMADGDGIVILFQDPAKPGQFLPQVIIAKRYRWGDQMSARRAVALAGSKR